MKFIKSLTIVISLLIYNPTIASEKDTPYPEESCTTIYEAIGLFLILADEQWHQKNEEKAMFYSTVSANYATIYETICRSSLLK